MTTNPTPKTWVETCQMAAIMLQNGHSQQEVLSAMMQEGVDYQTATELIASLVPEPIAAKRKAAWYDILKGVFTALLGVMLSWASLVTDFILGGIFWGFMATGAYFLLKGIVALYRLHNLKD